jgi:hypothetical protein
MYGISALLHMYIIGQITSLERSFYGEGSGWYPSRWAHAGIFAGVAAAVVVVDKVLLWLTGSA